MPEPFCNTCLCEQRPDSGEKGPSLSSFVLTLKYGFWERNRAQENPRIRGSEHLQHPRGLSSTDCLLVYVHGFGSGCPLGVVWGDDPDRGKGGWACRSHGCSDDKETWSSLARWQGGRLGHTRSYPPAGHCNWCRSLVALPYLDHKSPSTALQWEKETRSHFQFWKTALANNEQQKTQITSLIKGQAWQINEAHFQQWGLLQETAWCLQSSTPRPSTVRTVSRCTFLWLMALEGVNKLTHWPQSPGHPGSWRISSGFPSRMLRSTREEQRTFH